MSKMPAFSAFEAMLFLSLTAACGGVDPSLESETVGEDTSELGGHRGGRPPAFHVFSFASHVSTSGAYADGDVRLERIDSGHAAWGRRALQTVRSATIIVDDGVDEVRGGHNFASGQGIDSEPDRWEREGPATITPTGEELAESLGNLNLTSIVVTRENVGTASLEVRFKEPATRFFFWERGNANSPTTANSDLLVEALDERGRVLASHKLLRTEYTPTGIEITTWNGSFASPSTPGGAPPQLGSVGLRLDVPTRRLRLTSVQEAEGGVRDDGPDYKVIAATPGHDHHDHGHHDHPHGR